MNWLIQVRLIAIFLVGCTGCIVSAAEEEPVDFARDVLPILSDNCYHCHGPDPKEGRKGDLRLDDEADVKRERDGYHIVLPGKPDVSELFKRLTSTDEEEKMPPKELGRTLSPEQINTLRRWIEGGAEWGKNWAFQKISRPPISKSEEQKNPVDVFVDRTLKKKGVTANGLASKEVLIRRLKLDLTGLPPSPEEIDAFLSDDKPGAWERLVDQAIGSSSFGERMAWDWLEAARYSDTNGYQGDRERTMWPWRDWVVESFNKNTRWDEFTILQLAGDLLPNATNDQILASAFNRNHMINGEGGRIAEENRVDYVFDMTETLGTVWLGMTLNCCRCHDHKFDPVTQREYFELTAFFNQTPVTGAGGNPQTAPLLPTPTSDQAKREGELKIAYDSILKKQSILAKKLVSDQQRWEGNDARIPQWSPLPVSLAKAEKQSLTVQKDDTVLARGVNPDKDVYLISSGKISTSVRSVRLEALQHESLVNDGKGLSRAKGGNFVLTEFEILADGKPVRIRSAKASYQQQGFNIQKAFDGDPETGWAVFEKQGVFRPHDAVFLLEKPIPPNAAIQITMRQESKHVQHVIGRFRISTTPESSPRDAKGDAAFVAALKKDPAKRSKEEAKLVGQSFRNSVPEYRELAGQVAKAKLPLDNLRSSIPKVMVMGTQKDLRKTFILDRGLYNQPGQEVTAGVPASMPKISSEGVPNRLDLAKWLVARENPLMARVTVNRFWQMIFGIGLVKTPEDFGVQGEYPVQRELLDWLSAEFMESGWDVKKLIRTIVLSETWRRSSVIQSPSDFETDPENRLLARASRFRMPSWMLRDQALAASGLLNASEGGSPVYPYQPEGIWSEATFGKKKYIQSTGDSVHRRSVYTFWRRIVGPPVFFDSAKRQVCEVKPLRTNTPMHALTTLNDVTYVEAARGLAELVLESEKDDAARLSLAGRRVFGRSPTEIERAIWLRSLDRARKAFAADSASALEFLSHGNSKSKVSVPPATHAAWTALCLNLLNLDEALNRE